MLKVYNTLTRKKEIFRPRKNRRVNLFVCGPTVYNYMHIGHAKTYIQFDAIVKYLRYKKFKVFYLQNITDLDDKIINKAKEEKISPLDLAKKFEECYHRDEKQLGIDSITKYARATDYIKQIVKQTKTLIKKDYAYKISDGYYYDIEKFKDYGKLSGRTILGAEDAVSRIDESVGKRNKVDFCLWKFSKPNEPSWDTEIGEGRPGWHIEDTAITETNFGPQYDIHGGAKDLIFPHHEAEIAQMEAASGKKPMVRYWMHTGFLNVGGKKMSKSLKNFITVRDALKKHSPKALRFFYLTSHYRSPIDFSENTLEKAKNSLERLNDFVKKVKAGRNDDIKLIKKTKEKFISAMDDDFDTVKALAAIFNFIRECYKQKLGGKKAYKLIKEIDKIFGILEAEKKIEEKIKQLVQKRERYRQEKNWEKADELRGRIKRLGFWVEDTDEGPKIKKL